MARPAEREREAVDWMRRVATILDTGRWPSGLEVTPAERRVIVKNADRMVRTMNGELPPVADRG